MTSFLTGTGGGMAPCPPLDPQLEGARGPWPPGLYRIIIKEWLRGSVAAIYHVHGPPLDLLRINISFSAR